jgi:hypothetical protein
MSGEPITRAVRVRIPVMGRGLIPGCYLVPSHEYRLSQPSYVDSKSTRYGREVGTSLPGTDGPSRYWVCRVRITVGQSRLLYPNQEELVLDSTEGGRVVFFRSEAGANATNVSMILKWLRKDRCAQPAGCRASDRAKTTS